ncbi:uroporphyrinogen-III synthase [Flaviaesturariibacter aridisoli]|uniref:Uroporphyrinogen-III synthase n=1 Tax=Flaviaesturariibacter aridisoli TaxID=2545761 RepID=A0A4R4E7P6_9BACT|nr:uroporphyrinogen-III synthase [Flaviaesturariibacter aridisoli]TCZ74840.1 uroporphyrinogen-III synthase [Flaviaesturariibacter aridisoli]
MPKAERTILSTRPLPAALLLEAAASGFVVNCLSFIHTEAIEDPALTQRLRFLATEPHSVVFTSMNAVEAVAAQVRQTPHWKLYCIGNTTRALAESELGLKAAATADDAAALADRIIAAGEQELLFFCGNIRRDTLPVKLRNSGIALEEITVYRTEAAPQRIGSAYDAVLFFSPSAVQSFASVNQWSPSTVYFAIGSTTAEALRSAGAHRVISADGPGKETLLRRAMDYLKNITTTDKS